MAGPGYAAHVKGQISSSGFYEKFNRDWMNNRKSGISVMQAYGHTKWDVVKQVVNPMTTMSMGIDGVSTLQNIYEEVEGYRSLVTVNVGKKKIAEFEYRNVDRSDVLKMMNATSGELMDFIKNRCGLDAVLESSMLY